MSNLSLMNHPNLVVVHYNSYAGGKFWINCLSHHKQALPGLCVAAPRHTVDLWLLDDLNSAQIQQHKIDRINSAIPAGEFMHKWTQHELGCSQFWGNTLGNLLENSNDISSNAIQLLDQYKCFIVNHRPQDHWVEEIRNKFPLAQHVLLTNASNFQHVSMNKKQRDPWPLRVDTTSKLDAFLLDVDNTYMNVDLTIDHVKDCLQYLGLSTELDPNIHSFVKRYFDLHQ